MADYMKPVIFKLNDEMFGVDINKVQGIEKQINIVPVHNSTSYIDGIINLRGEVVTVYDLKKKLGMTYYRKNEWYCTCTWSRYST